MHDGPAAPEQGCDLAQALALTVHPSGFWPLVWLERMLAPAVLATTLGFGHAGRHTFADQFTLEFRDLRHHTEHQLAGRRGEINAECRDDDMDTALFQPLGNLQGVQGGTAKAVHLPDDQLITG